MDTTELLLIEMRKVNKHLSMITQHLMTINSSNYVVTPESRINYTMGIARNRFKDMDLIELEITLYEFVDLLRIQKNQSDVEIILKFDDYIIPIVKKRDLSYLKRFFSLINNSMSSNV
jgi:hypothetical protein